ncbi:MAG: hypothetical protein ABI905_02150 [Betaproteobacteria bacterium]
MAMRFIYVAPCSGIYRMPASRGCERKQIIFPPLLLPWANIIAALACPDRGAQWLCRIQHSEQAMKSTNETLSQRASTISVQTALLSSLKMLAAAVVCGLAVSFAAAGIAIALSGEAEARLVQKQGPTAQAIADEIEATTDDLPAGPGTLLTGDGCDGVAIQALERDWQVRIDGNRIDVRVMQSFQVPADSAGAAIFHVQLPAGARLRTLGALTAGKDWPAQIITSEKYEQLPTATYLKLTRNALLVSTAARGTVMTSPIMNLQPEEIVTVQYTYELTMDADMRGNGQQAFTLPLDATEMQPATPGRAQVRAQVRAQGRDIAAPTKAALWVEWVGKNPSQVWGLPADASLELTKTRIDGFSWAANMIEPGAFLQLSWAK